MKRKNNAIASITCLANNQRYGQQITQLEQQLEVVIRYERLKQLQTWLTQWDIIISNQSMHCVIAELAEQLLKIQTDKMALLQQLEVNASIKENLLMQKSLLEYQIGLALSKQKEKADVMKKIQSIEAIIRLYKEYEKIFNKNSLPYELMNLKLSSFNSLVNQIFKKYTHYQFNHEQSDNGKLMFIIKNKNNGCNLEPERLSGFESIILQLAINQAMMNISVSYQCGIIIIDESFDCIDQSKFSDQLPDIIEIIRMYYQTIICISHREIPANVIDKQLKIIHWGQHSTINN